MLHNKIIDKKAAVGWIGLGVMGAPMAAHILKAGYPVNVYNRSAHKAKSLLDQGARLVSSPGEAAEASDVVFTMVGFPADVEEVYFSQNGLFNGNIEGKIFVDMTTSLPSLAQKIAEHANMNNADAIDAPVSGGDVGAKNGSLSIMVGGKRDALEKTMPLLKILGNNIVYQGPAGAGQHTKMCNQITIAGSMIGVCEGLLYAYKAGLDPTVMLSSVSKGAAGCWTLDNLAPRIVSGNFEPGFFVEHFIKDMEIALAEARRMNLSLPGLALVHQLYVSLKAAGYGKKGTHALMLALERLSAMERAR